MLTTKVLNNLLWYDFFPSTFFAFIVAYLNRYTDVMVQSLSTYLVDWWVGRVDHHYRIFDVLRGPGSSSNISHPASVQSLILSISTQHRSLAHGDGQNMLNKASNLESIV